MSDLTANTLYKHLVLFNKEARNEYLVKGLSKMKKAQMVLEFTKRFKRKGNIYEPNSAFSDVFIKESDLRRISPHIKILVRKVKIDKDGKKTTVSIRKKK